MNRYRGYTMRSESLRSGFSLLEVLISMLIFMIGITGILVLYVIGVKRVSEAVVDTRTTLLAQASWANVAIHDMENDPLHRWSKPGVSDALDPPPPVNFLQTPFRAGPTDKPGQPIVTTSNERNLYANISTDDGVDPLPNGPVAANRLANVSGDGVPILIDPLWVHARYPTDDTLSNAPDWQNTRQTAIDFGPIALDAALTTLGPTFPTVRSCRVATVWGAASIGQSSVRAAYIHRWFTSPGDIEYREVIPGVPYAPSDSSLTDTGSTFPIATSSSSSVRNSPYSWALMVQREIVGATYPTVGPLKKSAVLIFRKRDLSSVFVRMGVPEPRPYTIAVAAFVNGDSRVTLYYPNGDRPRIRAGTWLCEVTIAGPGATDRRSFDFHKVIGFEEEYDSVLGRTYFRLALSKGVLGYNLTPRTTFPDAPPSAANPVQYYPVVIFDGLQEVFTREGSWAS